MPESSTTAVVKAGEMQGGDGLLIQRENQCKSNSRPSAAMLYAALTLYRCCFQSISPQWRTRLFTPPRDLCRLLWICERCPGNQSLCRGNTQQQKNTDKSSLKTLSRVLAINNWVWRGFSRSGSFTCLGCRDT